MSSSESLDHGYWVCQNHLHISSYYSSQRWLPELRCSLSQIAINIVSENENEKEKKRVLDSNGEALTVQPATNGRHATNGANKERNNECFRTSSLSAEN